MPLTRKQKEGIVGGISDALENNNVYLFAYFSKISVEKVRELRKNLKEKGASFKVIKKSLLETALKKAKVDTTGIDFGSSSGSLGVIFSKDDQLSPSKIIYTFSRAKENETFKVLGGVFDKQVLGIDKIMLLAKVNSKEDLLGNLLRQFQAPVSKLVYAVKAIADKKQQGV